MRWIEAKCKANSVVKGIYVKFDGSVESLPSAFYG